MTEPTQERLVKGIGAVLASAAGFAALAFDGDLELAVSMLAAVIAALACFDAALDRRVNAFWPWILTCGGILAKTIPTVLIGLGSKSGPAAERLDHFGSVLVGLCCAVAVAILAQPPKGAEHRGRLVGIVVVSGMLAAFAGAAAAFAGTGPFASRQGARMFEFFGWGTVGAMIAGVAIAIATTRRPTRPLAALLLGVLAIAALAARAAGGANDDFGWWALAFVLLALGSLMSQLASVGRDGGRRPSLVPTMVAVVAAVLGTQAAIAALGDSTSWRLAVYVLPVFATAILVLGVPLYRWGRGPDIVEDQARAGVLDAITDSHIPASEMTEVDGLPMIAATPGRSAALVRQSSAAAFSVALGDDAQTPIGAPAGDLSQSRASALEPAAAPAQLGPGSPPVSPAPPLVPPSLPVRAAESPLALSPDPGPAQSESIPAEMPVPVPAAPVQPAPIATHWTPALAPLPSLAPHLVDPTTGLLSTVGLQQALLDAFATPCGAGEISIVMVALGNLSAVEQQHGRVRANHAVRELATRFRTQLPEAKIARFATDGFAAVLHGVALEPQALIQRCATVLSDLLEPVAGIDSVIEIDVAAGMAQCYANEDVAGFVARANLGLERAVQAAEPTLVAMP